MIKAQNSVPREKNDMQIILFGALISLSMYLTALSSLCDLTHFNILATILAYKLEILCISTITWKLRNTSYSSVICCYFLFMKKSASSNIWSRYLVLITRRQFTDILGPAKAQGFHAIAVNKLLQWDSAPYTSCTACPCTILFWWAIWLASTPISKLSRQPLGYDISSKLLLLQRQLIMTTELRAIRLMHGLMTDVFLCVATGDGRKPREPINPEGSQGSQLIQVLRKSKIESSTAEFF